MMQWIIRVTTDAETAVGRYAEFTGENLYGPYDTATAKLRVREIESEFIHILADQGPTVFVYGAPKVEMLQLLTEGEAPGFSNLPFEYRAARNWILPAEDQEPDMLGRKAPCAS